jgi:hypothetical protein
MSQFENIIFGKKKFSDVLEEIYNNQKKKDQQVTALINELKPLISDIGDATLVVPLIKEYMEISVKNDDILIKMAALAQRAMATVTSDGSLTISDEEKDQLLKLAENTLADEITEQIKTVKENADYARSAILKPFSICTSKLRSGKESDPLVILSR